MERYQIGSSRLRSVFRKTRARPLFIVLAPVGACGHAPPNLNRKANLRAPTLQSSKHNESLNFFEGVDPKILEKPLFSKLV